MSTLITASSCAMSSPRAAMSVATSTLAAAVGKAHQHLVAVALVQLAVQLQRRKALRLQHLHQVAALLLGVAEGQRAHRPVVVQQQAHGVQALSSVTSMNTWRICVAAGASFSVTCCGSRMKAAASLPMPSG
jgi:hypothetical protein